MTLRAFVFCLFASLLVGCGNSNGPEYDLSDYDSYGSLYNMRLYVDKDMEGQQRSWVWESARAHYVSFWFGAAAIHTGPPMDMNFGPPLGQQTLWNTGDLIVTSGSNPGLRDMINVIVTKGRVIGNGPMGPGNHYRALATSRDTRYGYSYDDGPAIIIKPDKDGSGKCVLDGLFTMLHFYYNCDKFPTDQLGYHKSWSGIFIVDQAISDSYRNVR